MMLSTIRILSSTPIGRQQQKKLNQILNNLIDLPESTQFLHPVPWRQMQLDDYPHVVKHPMNLYKVQQKMKNRDYNTVEQCLDHIQLIWDNCKQYNNKQGGYWELADKMQKAYKKMIKNYLPNIQLVVPFQKPTTPLLQAQQQPLNKKLTKDQLPTRSSQNRTGSRTQQKGQNAYQQQSKSIANYNQQSQDQQNEQQQQVEQQISISQKNRFHQRLKQVTQQQLGQIVSLVQQSCPQSFKHMSGNRYQLYVDNLDGETFRRVNEKVDEYIENQKMGMQGQKKVKV